MSNDPGVFTVDDLNALMDELGRVVTSLTVQLSGYEKELEEVRRQRDQAQSLAANFVSNMKQQVAKEAESRKAYLDQVMRAYE